MTVSPTLNRVSPLPMTTGCACPRLAASGWSIIVPSVARSRQLPFVVPRQASGTSRFPVRWNQNTCQKPLHKWVLTSDLRPLQHSRMARRLRTPGFSTLTGAGFAGAILTAFPIISYTTFASNTSGFGSYATTAAIQISD